MMKKIYFIFIIFLLLVPALFAGENCWTQTGPTSWTVYDFAIDPLNPDTIYFGGIEPGNFGAYKSTDGGDSWEPMTDLPMGVGSIGISLAPSSSNIIFISCNWNSPAIIYKSEDYGETWEPSDNGLETVGGSIAINPNHPDTLYFASTYPYKSIDGGESWFEIGNGITNYYCIDIVINPINPNILYVCSIAQYFPAMVYKSINGGETWEEKADGLPLSYYNIFHLAIDPINPETIYAGVSGYDEEMNSFVTIYKTVNGGESWFEIGNGLDEEITSAPACLAIDPLRPNIIFAGFTQGYGIYRSENGGESWENFNVGLPEYEIKALAVSPTTPPTIYAGTENHGVWVYTDTTVGVNNYELQIMNYELKNYPNPFNPTTTISFNLQKRQRVSLCLYNLKGQKVKTIFKGTAGKGESSFILKADELGSGIYLYKLKTEKKEVYRKCVLLK